jgi:hypothetical protein
MIEEEKLPLSRNEAICTLVALIRMAADSPNAEAEIDVILNTGFQCLMEIGVSSTEIEAAAIYLSFMDKKSG